MRKLVLAISTLTLATSMSFADPQQDREALMKQNGAVMGGLSAYVKGEKPYDPADVLALLTKLDEDARSMEPATLWPAGSETAESESSPKIWEDAAGFQAAVDKFRADTGAALATPPADVDALKAQMGVLGSNCSSCHQAYRVKKS